MTRFRWSVPASSQPAPQAGRLYCFVREVSRFFFLIACLSATAGLFYISYPKISLSFAAWLVLAPFVWGVSKVRTMWGALGYGWLTGLGTYAALLMWIYPTCLQGGGLSQTLSLAAWLGLSALLAVQFAVFGVSCHFLRKTGMFFPLLAACGWVALEWVHQTVAFYGIGFPWVMLGYSQWNVPQVLYLAGFVGVYGLSFVLAFTGSCVGWCFAEPGFKKGMGQLLVAVLVFAGVYGWGQYMQKRYARFAANPHALLSVQAALLQPNIDQYRKWTPEYEDEIAQTLQQMGASLTGQNLYLAVWPESVVPGALTEERYFRLFSQVGGQAGVYQVIGSNISSGNIQQVGAYLLPPEADKLVAYRKVKLVPFGEFIPFEKVIKKMIKEIDVMGALGAFVPGEMKQPLLDAGGVKIGTTICYESIFPQLWRAQNKQGAQLFVNITNDAWFFNTAAPYQHLAVNVLRAAENGRPVLRAANTGFSAYIDGFGNIREKSGLFTQEILKTNVPLSVRDKSTFYAQWGDWFAWVCALIFFTVGISVVVFWYE